MSRFDEQTKEGGRKVPPLSSRRTLAEQVAERWKAHENPSFSCEGAKREGTVLYVATLAIIIPKSSANPAARACPPNPVSGKVCGPALELSESAKRRDG
jgi:hypothetical protein